MKIKLNREQKIGLYAVVIITALFFVINFLRGRDVFGSTNIYYTVYENVDGLSKTGPVYIKGLKVGTIQDIDYQEEKDNFLVALKVDSRYKIPEGSVAQIFNSSILGGNSIRINIIKGGRILGEKDTLLPDVELALIDKLTGELLPLKDQASELITNLNKTFENVNEVLDPKAKQHLANSLENLDKTLKSIKSIASNLENNGPEISSLIDNLDNVSASLDKSMGTLDKGLNNVVEITDSLKKADLAGTITSLRKLLIDINDPHGTVGKLIKTDTLHNSIDSLVRDIDVLIESIQKDPKKYIKISVF